MTRSFLSPQLFSVHLGTRLKESNCQKVGESVCPRNGWHFSRQTGLCGFFCCCCCWWLKEEIKLKCLYIYIYALRALESWLATCLLSAGSFNSRLYICISPVFYMCDGPVSDPIYMIWEDSANLSGLTTLIQNGVGGYFKCSTAHVACKYLDHW